MQDDLDLTVIPLDQLVSAVVPDGDRATAVFTPGNLPMERRVFHRVVLGVHGEVVAARIVRHALGQRPGDEYPVALEPEVPVQAPRVVLLDDEDPGAGFPGGLGPPRSLSRRRRTSRLRDAIGWRNRFWCARRIPLAPVIRQPVHTRG